MKELASATRELSATKIKNVSFLQNDQVDEFATQDKPDKSLAIIKFKYVGWKEIVVIALGLCFTNIASGIAAGLAGYSVIWTVIGTLIASFLLLQAGTLVGKVFGAVIPSSYVNGLTGVILLAVGVLNI